MSASGSRAAITLSCHGAAGPSCRGTVAFSIKVHRLITRGVATADTDLSETSRETVASTAYRIAAGRSATVALGLDGAGRQLLARLHRLPGVVAISGPGAMTAPLTFVSGPVRGCEDRTRVDQMLRPAACQ